MRLRARPGEPVESAAWNGGGSERLARSAALEKAVRTPQVKVPPV